MAADKISECFNSKQAEWFFRRLQSTPRFAHHPTCKCYENHLLRIAGHPICLGCLCVSMGVSLALLFLCTTYAYSVQPPFLRSCFWTEMMGVILFLPTLVQPFAQLKPYKIISRISLGIAIVLLWHGAIFLLPFNVIGILLRTVFLLVFVFTFRLALAYRKRLTPEPSVCCSHERYPLCDGNKQFTEKVYRELCSRSDPNDPFLPIARSIIDSTDGSIDVF